ncbi:MAG: hypothetical protein ACPL88_06600, partial [Bryobacteraceae bacterium]
MNRQWRIAFAALTLIVLLLAPGQARAQVPFSCTASATSIAVRAEGLAELVGDLVLTCTGGTAGQPITMTVQIFANTNITSRILSPPDGVEALLLIDNPPYSPSNVVTGKLVATGNSVIFAPVNTTQPGSGTRTLRIVNVRVNAAQLPVASAVNLSVTASSTAAIPITNPTQQVAVTQTGLAMQVRKTDDSAAYVPSLLTCTGNNTTLLTGGDYPPPPAPGGRTINIKFIEGFANAFRPLAGEHGTQIASLPPPYDRAGRADHGTRLRAVFSNVPAGVAVFVTTREVLQGTTLGAEARCTTTPGGGFAACTPSSPADGGLYRVPISATGTGEAYWEVTSSNPGTVETISFGVAVAYNPTPPAGTVNVLGSFSPISNQGNATVGPDDLPRFVSLLSPAPAFILEACRTVLLFQFLTSIPGWDTGIAVTNTTLDSPLFNTTGQSGRCRAYFYQPGVSVPPLESPEIPPGGQWLWTLYSYKPNFQGYMLVSCDFQHAYGFAF